MKCFDVCKHTRCHKTCFHLETGGAVLTVSNTGSMMKPSASKVQNFSNFHFAYKFSEQKRMMVVLGDGIPCSQRNPGRRSGTVSQCTVSPRFRILRDTHVHRISHLGSLISGGEETANCFPLLGCYTCFVTPGCHTCPCSSQADAISTSHPFL